MIKNRKKIYKNAVVVVVMQIHIIHRMRITVNENMR